ncbi:hypothetical protein TSTA_062260 [Talaromyces stipitatus ATCC 10500]|uniref:Uncharacterized protein n=1 Tax=Talaromyces stipitatus (strain ATCC 10500 / CBS 375.48 / QM 6759 / NRRL 1006) TaxID=441959 RepID=B8LX89_TALSN|nr:uncharacterized protein TSTA_062260 [Talaromyces stipitatus ATCC 10500]EED22739.1 hypothetical protein TSTA_062260 [Talaromyces stipitatus ATCC 10500]
MSAVEEVAYALQALRNGHQEPAPLTLDSQGLLFRYSEPWVKLRSLAFALADELRTPVTGQHQIDNMHFKDVVERYMQRMKTVIDNIGNPETADPPRKDVNLPPSAVIERLLSDSLRELESQISSGRSILDIREFVLTRHKSKILKKLSEIHRGIHNRAELQQRLNSVKLYLKLYMRAVKRMLREHE